MMRTQPASPLRRLASLALVFFALVAPTQAENPVSPETSRAIQAVVRAQLDAFAADDAAGAFAHTTPGIREVFGTADNFMRMVRDKYPVVYRSASVSFLVPRDDGEFIAQPVHMTDTRGSGWIALFRMQKQAADGQWLVAGCALMPASGGRTV